MSPTFICGGVVGVEGMGPGADPKQTRGQLLSPLKAACAEVANHTMVLQTSISPQHSVPPGYHGAEPPALHRPASPPKLRSGPPSPHNISPILPWTIDSIFSLSAVSNPMWGRSSIQTGTGTSFHPWTLTTTPPWNCPPWAMGYPLAVGSTHIERVPLERSMHQGNAGILQQGHQRRQGHGQPVELPKVLWRKPARTTCMSPLCPSPCHLHPHATTPSFTTIPCHCCTVPLHPDLTIALLPTHVPTAPSPAITTLSPATTNIKVHRTHVMARKAALPP